MPCMRTVWRAAFAVALAATAGCSDTPIDVVGAPPNIAAMVTPELANQLDGDGHFRATYPPEPEPSEITEGQARELAAFWVSDLAKFVVSSLEEQHGGTINVAALRDCGRIYYGRTPYEPLDAAVPASLKRAFGSWWYVPLCGGSTPQVLLFVSTESRGLIDWINGRSPSEPLGGHFRWAGIPDGAVAKRLLSPEEAVQSAWQLTGARASRQPELIVGEVGPIWAAWRVYTERPVQVRKKQSDRGTIVSAEFLVGRFYDSGAGGVLSWEPASAVAASDQPTGRRFSYAPDPRNPSIQNQGLARRRSDMPFRMILVEPATPMPRTP